MNYLERFSFSERKEYAIDLLRQKALLRVLKAEKSKKADLQLYHFFLGSKSAFLVCVFTEMRKTAKKILRGGN